MAVFKAVEGQCLMFLFSGCHSRRESASCSITVVGVVKPVFKCDNGGSRGVAQPGSASALGAEGREFESLRPDH
jgi:hypothetical protein